MTKTEAKELDPKKFYKPKFGDEETKLETSKEQSTSNETLNSIAENGIIEVEIDAKTVKQRIAKDLYSSYESGFRELFNNEARACRTAIKNHNAKSRIEITINPETSQLIIEGIDSMGVTSEVFKESLRVLGVSGNVSGNEIGQFGFGFASYTTISDMVKFETWARETNEKYTLMGKNGVDFQILDNKDKLDTFGTRLTLTYNDNVSPQEIYNLTHTLARFAGCPVKIHLKEDIDIGGYRSSIVNSGDYDCKVYKDIRDFVDQKILGTLRERTTGYGTNQKTIKEEEDWRITLDIQEEDYEFYGVLIQSKWKEKRQVYKKDSNKKTYITETRTDCKTFGHGTTLLVGTPIMDGLHINDFTECVVNIKNERKFPPTADRDRLTAGVKETLQPIIEAEIKKKLDTELKINSLEEYKKSKYKHLLSSSRFQEYLPEAVTDFRSTLRIGVVTEPNGYSSSLENHTKSPNDLVYMLKWDGALVKAIREHNPKLLVGKVSSYDVERLAKHGAISAQQYKENHGLKVVRNNTKAKGTAVIWGAQMSTSGSTYYSNNSVSAETETIDIKDIDKDHTIIINKVNRNRYLQLLKTFEHSYKLTTEISAVKEKAQQPIDFYNSIKDTELEVSWSKKKMSIAKIVKESGRKEVAVYSKDTNILATMKKFKMLLKTTKYIICPTYDDYFKLAFADRYINKDKCDVVMSTNPYWTHGTTSYMKYGERVEVYRAYNSDYPTESELRQIDIINDINDEDIMTLYAGLKSKARLDPDILELLREVMAKCAKA